MRTASENHYCWKSDSAARSYFVAVDQHHRGAIDVYDLQRALVNGDFTRFDFDTVVMLARQFDVRRTGLITFDEFIALYKCVPNPSSTMAQLLTLAGTMTKVYSTMVRGLPQGRST